MADIKDIPTQVLDKVKEYACLRYGVSSEEELKAAIVDERFAEIVSSYYDEVKTRILRKKADEVKEYIPTEVELIVKLQEKIDLVAL